MVKQKVDFYFNMVKQKVKKTKVTTITSLTVLSSPAELSSGSYPAQRKLGLGRFYRDLC